MRKLLAVLAVAVLPACSTVQLSASESCVNLWGSKIPEAQRTLENCASDPRFVTQRLAQLNQTPVTGSATASTNTAHALPSGTYYTPNGSYQVTRSGSQTFIARASKR